MSDRSSHTNQRSCSPSSRVALPVNARPAIGWRRATVTLWFGSHCSAALPTSKSVASAVTISTAGAEPQAKSENRAGCRDAAD